MHLPNEVVLRPRFQIELNQSHDNALSSFEKAKSSQSRFIVSRVDDHVFIRIPKGEQHFWSPQLHLEINEVDENSCRLHGLFGPNPTVWTMFMFFHFMVAGLFIAFGIWAYSNWSLKADYALQLFGCLFMIVVWFALYFAGRLGRASSKNEMIALDVFMKQTLHL